MQSTAARLYAGTHSGWSAPAPRRSLNWHFVEADAEFGNRQTAWHSRHRTLHDSDHRRLARLVVGGQIRAGNTPHLPRIVNRHALERDIERLLGFRRVHDRDRQVLP